jgi:hypothetical protein
VPPYSLGPPAGIAYLLAYAHQQGCSDFGFRDLRLGVPDAYAPTYAHTGVFGDAYVMDVPDLPLVLSLVQAVDSGKEPTSGFPSVIEKYCRERGISASYLRELLCLDLELFDDAALCGPPQTPSATAHCRRWWTTIHGKPLKRRHCTSQSVV